MKPKSGYGTAPRASSAPGALDRGWFRFTSVARFEPRVYTKSAVATTAPGSSRSSPTLACWTIVFGALRDTPRIRRRRRSPAAGSRFGATRNVEGMPSPNSSTGDPLVRLTLLLMRPGAFRAIWSSLPTRSNRL
jgi:hypothetical protein